MGETAVLEIGDSVQVTPSINIIAVQREKAIFWEDEFNFRDYPIFKKEIPQPIVDEEIEMTIKNESPLIRVQNIFIRSLVGSSVVHIGSSEMIQSETREKHIRHLLREKNQ